MSSHALFGVRPSHPFSAHYFHNSSYLRCLRRSSREDDLPYTALMRDSTLNRMDKTKCLEKMNGSGESEKMKDLLIPLYPEVAGGRVSTAQRNRESSHEGVWKLTAMHFFH